MFIIEFFNSIIEYLMLYILGCVFADISLRNMHKNAILILIFSFYADGFDDVYCKAAGII